MLAIGNGVKVQYILSKTTVLIRREPITHKKNERFSPDMIFLFRRFLNAKMNQKIQRSCLSAIQTLIGMAR